MLRAISTLGVNGSAIFYPINIQDFEFISIIKLYADI